MTTKHRSAAALSQADPEAPLESWCLDPPGATLGFAVKLARENGSTTQRAERLIAEYRLLLPQPMRSSHPVGPSDAWTSFRVARGPRARTG